MPAEDAAVYEMLCAADSIGVFQVESRAQMSMLPRLRPRTFYDLVIEVAIVRPGPIQGDMVHPYLRRRDGLEPVVFPRPELAEVLGKTLGVPLFQEQAMKIAIVAAGFTPAEADGLSALDGGVPALRPDRAMAPQAGRAAWWAAATTRTSPSACFKQIEGFGYYGFPESHSASFALLVYVSAWLKCHYPDVFCAAILNAQPMGFYAPAQLVRDAVDHGVEVRPVDVNYSHWDSTLEPRQRRGPLMTAVRLGLRQIKGLPAAGGRPDRHRPAQALPHARGAEAAGGPAAGDHGPAGRGRRLPLAGPRPAPGAVGGPGAQGPGPAFVRACHGGDARRLQPAARSRARTSPGSSCRRWAWAST